MDPNSPWALGGLTVTELGKRVYKEINDDDVFGRAAQLAYYFLLALFPLLLFLISLLGVVAGDNSDLRNDLFGYLGTVLPKEASGLVVDNANEAIQRSGGGKISFGILAALWAASNGMGAILSSLNVAYEVEESRSWIRQRLTSIGLTIALAVLVITALVGVLYGHDIIEAVAGNFGLGSVFEWTWKIVQYPIIISFVLLAFGLIYYFAPDVKETSWHFVTPGALVGVGLWLLVSFAFNLYLSYFNSYNATYGALGGVIILMLWLYLTGAAILIGGEINSEIEAAAAEHGAPGAKQEGEKHPNEKSAPGAKKPATKNSDKPGASVAKTVAASPGVTPRPGNSDTSATRVKVRASRSREPLTLGKVFVVAGSWVFGKITGRR